MSILAFIHLFFIIFEFNSKSLTCPVWHMPTSPAPPPLTLSILNITFFISQVCFSCHQYLFKVAGTPWSILSGCLRRPGIHTRGFQDRLWLKAVVCAPASVCTRLRTDNLIYTCEPAKSSTVLVESMCSEYSLTKIHKWTNTWMDENKWCRALWIGTVKLWNISEF